MLWIAQFKIALHDPQGDVPFPSLIAELFHIGIGVTDDALGSFGVCGVIIHLLNQIAEVGLYFHIMDIALQTPFHKPCLTGRRWSDRERIGRHNPFQVTGHIVAFQRHDVFVFQMVVKRKPRHDFVSVGVVSKQATFGQGIGCINTRMILKLLQKLDSVLTRAHLTAKNSPVLFFRKRNLVPEIDEMATLVQFEKHCIGVVGLQVAAFDNGGDGRDVPNVAKKIAPFQLVRKP